MNSIYDKRILFLPEKTTLQKNIIKTNGNDNIKIAFCTFDNNSSSLCKTFHNINLNI